MSALESTLQAAVNAGSLLDSTRDNVMRVYKFSGTLDWARASIDYLVEKALWTELNDRFYTNLKFGTGGIRGRTIAKVITPAEQGSGGPLGRPQYAAVGTNMMNEENIRRAALGLGEYLLKAFPGKKSRVVIAHDTRHFSRSFAELVAAMVQSQGIDAFLFAEDRSTPQLSFSVRWLKAQAGVVISASHNPSHDNGFKCYFADGGQVVEPHATGIIGEVNRLAAGAESTKASASGTLTILDRTADEAYLKALDELVLEPQSISKAKGKLKVVYSSLHGTGIRIIPELLKRFGFDVSIVEEQATGDGRFPTVQSPNPENAEALSIGIAQARKENADMVVATDPDCDRMGVALRNASGEFEIITGNMIGSILAEYRTSRLFAQGILNEKNRAHATLIKTFVTTDLQKAIAAHYGIRCIDTLTGFKYIGEKLGIYQAATGLQDYDEQSLEARRTAHLERGMYFVFGGEESYGYSGSDRVRDKDANAAALMFAEVGAWTTNKSQLLLAYLDEIYTRFGFYTEKLGTLTFEGAAGAAKIQKLLASYRSNPPKEFMGQAVTEIKDFERQELTDIDGKRIPKELMFLFHLKDGSRMAVRGSGTEPKIKFYFFTQAKTEGSLAEVKSKRREFLNQWWDSVQQDVSVRVA